MQLFIIEELAKHLDLPPDGVSDALSEFIDNVKSEVDTHQSSDIPGVGTFELTDGALSFTPAETLALAVNNRYAALDAEMIQLGFEEPDFPLSETPGEGNDREIDQSLIDQFFASDKISKGLFDDEDDLTAEMDPILETDPFEGDLDEPEQENSISPSPDAKSSETAVEPASMKEDDPKSNNKSKQDPLGSDTEWSPFFEELEGEEFDIDNTIDLNADDWEEDVAPSSPFASSSDSSDTNADDLYFDVDADPDDTLFAPAASIDVEDPSADDLSWASAPMDDTDFFEDDPSMSSSFGEEVDILASMSPEDEFFSPVSGSSKATPDDTMFSPDSIYSEDDTTEADETIFLAPDQTVQSNSESKPKSPFATSSGKRSGDAAPKPRSRNPYAYRDARKKSKSGFPWIAVVIGVILILGGGVAYWQGWIPIGASNETPATQNMTSSTPLDTVDPSAGPETNVPEDLNTENLTPENTTATAETQTPEATSQVAPPPPVQHVGIDRSRGGWTIIVTSREQRQEAERIADNFIELFGGSQVPIDILTTNQFANTRYRVGIGQFSSSDEARNFKNRNEADLPGDAWILRIE